MFGSLRVEKRALSRESRDLYQAHFCAGCQALARFGGRPAALLTSYDQTFLFFLLVLSALEDDGTTPGDLDVVVVGEERRRRGSKGGTGRDAGVRAAARVLGTIWPA
ncbi:MAG: DUF5685 family protein [Planctomycetota bacterium]|nr:DUF5685 family protein [Planctomycetota bacterium]